MFSAPQCLVKIILESKHNFDKKVFKGYGWETQVMGLLNIKVLSNKYSRWISNIVGH